MGTPFMDQAIKLGHIQAIFDTAKGNFKASPVLALDSLLKFKKISERGHGYLLHDAYKLYKEGRYEQALLSYRMGAFCGLEIAQENVAYLFERQTNSDLSMQAFPYWNRAAIQGSSRARIKLADYYYYGEGGVRQDFSIAAEHYRFAEELRDSQAAFNLAYMYEHGLGIQMVEILIYYCSYGYLLTTLFRITIWRKGITTRQSNMNQRHICLVKQVLSRLF